MYKRASMFFQSLRQRGASPTSGEHLHGKGHKPNIRKGHAKRKTAKRLEAVAEERQQGDWSRYESAKASEATWRLRLRGIKKYGWSVTSRL
jgi:hypothetical protein